MKQSNLWFRAVARARCRDDEGVVAIVVALLLVAILFAAALAIDGGQGYSTGRAMQNSADSAAMAGMRQLDLVKQGKATAGTVNGTVVTALTNNKSTVFTGVICKIVDYNASEIGDCNATNEANDTAAGVKVFARTKSTNEFGKAVGSSDTFDVARTATVLAKPVTNVANAPFAVCTGPQPNTKNGSTNYNWNGTLGYTGTSYAEGAILPPLLQTRYIPSPNPPTSQASWTTTASTTTWYDMPWYLPSTAISTMMANFPMYATGVPKIPANARFQVNPAAIGITYPVHNNQSNFDSVFNDCSNQDAGWKGLLDTSWPLTVPGEADAKTGAAAGLVQAALSSNKSCTLANNEPTGCYLILPICVGGNTSNGTNFHLYCTNWGTFELKGGTNGGNDHWFKLVNSVPIDSSTGGATPGTGVPDWGGVKIYQQVA